MGSKDYIPPTVTLPHVFSYFLTNQDVDSAFDLWCRTAEKLLCQIPQVSDSGAASYDDGKFRGRVRFQKQCMYPKSKDASVLTLHCRRVADALGRANELARSHAFGYRQMSTWRNIHKVHLSLSRAQWLQLEPLLQQTLSPEVARQVATMLETFLKTMQSADKQARISAWKKRLQDSEKHSYAWANGDKSLDDCTMKLPNGTTTANELQQLRTLRTCKWLVTPFYTP